MDKLKLMKTFVFALEEGSIVGAAKKLGITKAGASKQIIDLENELKIELLKRTTRTLIPTDAGKIFYESAKKIFSILQESEAALICDRQEPKGTLRITSHYYFGEKYIVNNLKEFMGYYPDLDIDLELAERFPDLEKEKIDILFGIGFEGPEHLVRRKITSTYHLLCASPDYLKEYGTPRTPDDLKKHRYITHSIRNPNNLLRFGNYSKEIILKPHIKLNDSQAMLHCALQGAGIVKLHNYLVEDAIKHGHLKEILKKYREPQKSIYVFYQQQKFMQPKIRLFLDFIYKKMELDL